MKAILMSIKPKWCEKIFSGEKTIEVRKTTPKLETPFKVLVYCTTEKTGGGFLHTSNHKDRLYVWSNPDDTEIRVEPDGYTYTAHSCRGKVIGEFVCERVRAYIPFGLRGFELFPEWLEQICLSKEQLDKYGGLKTLYGWHITEPKLYDKPRELAEFSRYGYKEIEHAGSGYIFCGNTQCGYCEPAEVIAGLYKPPVCIKDGCRITRPPQSWCYVEEVVE